MINSNEIIEKLEKRLMTFSNDPKTDNVGKVIKNTDGVITASGLSRVGMGEIVIFSDDSTGVVFNLDEEFVSIIVLSGGGSLREGDTVKSTGNLLNINVSDEILGRVVNPMGDSLDGKIKIEKGKSIPLERIAAGVIDREPVDTPLKTGIKAIDTMIPVGRGQRELIIGDRGLGKTAVAIDAIINQKNILKTQKQVICIYVAIGQKQSTVAQIIQRLKDEGSFHYTVVVVAGASDSAAQQYLAPYAGTSIAEYFMEKGEDVLIVYDDLTKHAWAYRQLSLVLRRPAGREAYPGDIFYLHSRLLERSVKLNKDLGGGSITSFPIIETQAGDISAYIATNVISITDGQIFLQSDLFNSGIRPAINAGNSVSRIGGSAQTKAMKSIAGKTRLELAQFRALEAFAQFGSELDVATISQLERGKRTVEILKQSQYNPLSEAFQILSIWCVGNGYLDNIKIEDVQRFELEMHSFVNANYKNVIDLLASGEKIKETTLNEMKKALEAFKNSFNKISKEIKK